MPKRPPEDIDPRGEDVAAKPRKRRHRSKPEPLPQLKASKGKALSRAQKRPLSPAVMFEREGDHYAIHAPHSDADLWELTLADAFATRSMSVIRSFTGELKGLCRQVYDDQDAAWKPNETELNAILAMVASAQPKTTAEAALVAQSVAVHLLTMRLAAQALNSGGMVLDRDAALVGKLARTYAMQMDQLQAMKGKRRTARQSIKVTKDLHQHVHYHDERGAGGTGRQPHDAGASEPAQCAALPSPEPSGQVVRLPCRKGKAGV